jgi:hypothetical protein
MHPFRHRCSYSDLVERLGCRARRDECRTVTYVLDSTGNLDRRPVGVLVFVAENLEAVGTGLLAPLPRTVARRILRERRTGNQNDTDAFGVHS